MIGREDEVFVNNTNVGACTQDSAETLLTSVRTLDAHLTVNRQVLNSAC